MANEHNLIPAQKGEVRNPNGRGKGVPNSKTRLLRLLELVTKVRNPVTGEDEEFTIAEQLDMQIIAKARKGDLKALTFLALLADKNSSLGPLALNDVLLNSSR